MEDQTPFYALIARVQKSPRSLISCERLDDKFGSKLEVKSHNDLYCPFFIEWSNTGLYSLSFGHGLHFENLSNAEFQLQIVADAIMDGKVAETTWFLKRIIAKSVGSITLPDGRVLHDRNLDFAFLARFAREVTFNYLPYPTG
jgi:hypothetical protein